MVLNDEREQTPIPKKTPTRNQANVVAPHGQPLIV
jgi:hypothetical protein